LYDQQIDMAEKVDFAANHPEVVARIESYLSTTCTDAPDWQPKWPDAKR